MNICKKLRLGRAFLISTFLGLATNLSCESSNDSENASSRLVNTTETAETDPRETLPLPQSRQQIQTGISSSRANAITRAIEKLKPAVVGINVTQIKEFVTRGPSGDWFFEYFFSGRTIQQEVKSMGSGFFISQDGYVVTNEHVVHNAVNVVVFLSDGRKLEADIVGKDYISDIALLKIEGENFPYCELGDSDDIIIGEWVIALGNPFGLFELGHQPTATVGVISANNLDFGKQGDDRVYQDMIQTDAAINPGNSGGAMANAIGQVVGINTFIYTGSENSQGSIGLGFAIPINSVKTVVEQLKNYGRVDRQFWTGLEVESLRPSVARYFGLRDTRGVIVSDVERNSPADNAGFRVGDIITQFAGSSVESTRDIWEALDDVDARAGDALEVMIIRKGRLTRLHLKLGKVRS